MTSSTKHTQNVHYFLFFANIRAYFASVVKLQEYEIQASQTHVQLSVQERC